MRILFDSHALVWFLSGDERFPERLRQTASEAEIVVSAVCVWEMATKVARRKWPEAESVLAVLDDVLDADTCMSLPITIEHARVAGFLPGRHRDPFDRMLAAQSQVEAIPLLTADPAFKEFGVRVIW
jgi:PIN domain nuclease of toxin-antitoxin system